MSLRSLRSSTASSRHVEVAQPQPQPSPPRDLAARLRALVAVSAPSVSQLVARVKPCILHYAGPSAWHDAADISDEEWSRIVLGEDPPPPYLSFAVVPHVPGARALWAVFELDPEDGTYDLDYFNIAETVAGDEYSIVVGKDRDPERSACVYRMEGGDAKTRLFCGSVADSIATVRAFKAQFAADALAACREAFA